MSSHDLKVWPEFFAPLERGDKLFELRRDDRDFKVGDWLKLREWAPPDIANAKPGGFTGARCLRRISYVLRAADVPNFLAPGDGVPRLDAPLAGGHVILGLAPPITDLEFGLFGKRLFVGTVERAVVRQVRTYLQGLYDFLEEKRREALAARSKGPKPG